MAKSKFRPLHDRVVVKRIDADAVAATVFDPATLAEAKGLLA